MSAVKTTLPLEGIKVIDLATFGAAPICAMTLADWGADVIKVETLNGDAFRYFGFAMKCPITEDDNIMWELENRNKRGVSVDLKTAGGKEILSKLLASADVMVTNMRPDALKRLELDYETTSKLYPRLIYAYLSGYGDQGPDRNKPGFDLPAFFARSGILLEFGEPGTEPMPGIAGFGDHTTGTFLVGGVCAALLNRYRTNRGCKVNIALYNAALWNLSLNIVAANNQGVFPRQSRKNPRSALMNTYQTKDGKWVNVTMLEYDKYWKPLCIKVLNRPDMAEDPRFSTMFAGFENGAAAAAQIQGEFEKYTLAELKPRLNGADIAYEVCQRWHEIKNDEQALINGFIMEQHLASGRKEWVIGNPVKYNSENTVIRRNAPKLGEHNREVLKELGYSSVDIAKLIKNNIVK